MVVSEKKCVLLLIVWFSTEGVSTSTNMDIISWLDRRLYGVNLLLAEPNHMLSQLLLFYKYKWEGVPSKVIWITHTAAGDNTQRYVGLSFAVTHMCQIQGPWAKYGPFAN